MIPIINAHPKDWVKDVYIASKIGVQYDIEGNEIPVYDKPNKNPYKFNYQSVSTDADIAEFGENAKIMKKAVIPISYQGQFKEFDVAYLDGATPEGEENYGDNANYRLLPPRDGNSVIIIYFEKLTGK
jgi:hypothetical protein